MVPRFVPASMAAATALAATSFAHAQTAPWLAEPAHAAVDRTPVRERGDAPLYYRGADPHDRFGIRPLLGGGVRFVPNGAPSAAFALDIDAQAAWALDRGAWQWMFRTEVAYSLFTGGGPAEQVVGVGAGLALGSIDGAQHGLTVALVPRVVFGSALGDFAAGERTALSLEWVGDGPLLAISVFHELLATDRGTVADVGIAIGFGAGIALPHHEVFDGR